MAAATWRATQVREGLPETWMRILRGVRRSTHEELTQLAGDLSAAARDGLTEIGNATGQSIIDWRQGQR